MAASQIAGIPRKFGTFPFVFFHYFFHGFVGNASLMHKTEETFFAFACASCDFYILYYNYYGHAHGV